MNRWSLRSRLLFLFTLAVLTAWCLASITALREINEDIDEILDAQLAAFAEHIDGISTDMLLDDSFQSAADGRDLAAFAVFDRNGGIILNNGLHGFISPPHSESENLANRNGPDDQGRWRVLWSTRVSEKNPEIKYDVVVAQHLDYREELAWEMIESQVFPWLAVFPLLLLAVSLLLRREFRPLKNVADNLAVRAPEDGTPIGENGLPVEVRPFITALNALFVRVSNTLLRERRFTSDAAHELRSPLAGLRVQAEVAQIAGDDPVTRDHALRNLTNGIDRTARLVEQLLELSRLDSLSSLTETQSVDWRQIVRESMDSFREEAERRGVELSFEYAASPPEILGHRFLLSLLFRNLFDNALRYSSPSGHVWAVLTKEGIRVDDDGPGVAPSNLPRLGERFFRLTGQGEIGTGLGLSIVKRVAELHGMRIEFANRLEGGLSVRLFLDIRV